MPEPRIDTLDGLREHLQWAIELEHATLPPYLTALYSLDPARNPAAVEVVSSVFVEEMLHLALAAELVMPSSSDHRYWYPACQAM